MIDFKKEFKKVLWSDFERGDIDEYTMQRAYTVQVTEGAKNEVLIVLHIPCVYLEHVVIFSRCIETFHHLINHRNHRSELLAVFLAMMLQTDVTQDHDSIACLDRIHDSDIFFDIPFTLKSFLPLKDRRWRQIHLRSQLFGRQIGIFL